MRFNTEPVGGTSTGQAPAARPNKIIVVLAFARDDEGELRPAFEPREAQSEGAAKQQARLLATAGKYEGVIAWWRSADLVNGVFGEPVVLFQHGDVPEMG